jgi:hypothetical protein
MTTLRIFLSYDSSDAAFAKQLATDLRASGAEIMMDNPELEDMALEQFLSEKLSRCQQFLVIQTPESLRSPRMQTVLEVALKYMQDGPITGVLRVIARTFDPTQAQVVPSLWAAIPALEASQDYPRALARLRSHLGLKDDSQPFFAPPPAAAYWQSSGSSKPVGTGKEFLMAYSSYNTQRPDAKDRPVRPLWRSYAPLRSRFALISLALLLVLGLGLTIAGIAIFRNQSLASAKSTPLATPQTPTPTAPAIDASKLTPAQLYNAVTSRPTFYSSALSQEDNADWDRGNQCQFAGGAYHATMPAAGHVGFQACFERAFLLSDFAFQVRMTIHSGVNNDGGGLLFRSQNGDGGYRFHVGINGSYDLTYMSNTSLYGMDPTLKPTSLLTVIAQGPLIFLYVDKHLLAQTSDTSATQGQLGFMAVSFSQDANVTLTNAQIWKL